MKAALRRAGVWARTLHIYASMAGFVLILLFAITGLTLNHQESAWGAAETATTSVTVPMALVKAGDVTALEANLHQALHITTPASSFEKYDEEINIAFHSPGRRIHVLINRSDGVAKVVTESRGAIGLINDLHKGMETGGAWRWLVDLTAVLVGFSALSGLATLISHPKRRVAGILTMVFGAGAVVAIYLIFVPR